MTTLADKHAAAVRKLRLLKIRVLKQGKVVDDLYNRLLQSPYEQRKRHLKKLSTLVPGANKLRCKDCGSLMGVNKAHKCRHIADGLTKDQRRYRRKNNRLALPVLKAPPPNHWHALLPPQCEG